MYGRTTPKHVGLDTNVWPEHAKHFMVIDTPIPISGAAQQLAAHASPEARAQALRWMGAH